jgi:hypothetical protein
VGLSILHFAPPLRASNAHHMEQQKHAGTAALAFGSATAVPDLLNRPFEPRNSPGISFRSCGRRASPLLRATARTRQRLRFQARTPPRPDRVSVRVLFVPSPAPLGIKAEAYVRLPLRTLVLRFWISICGTATHFHLAQTGCNSRGHRAIAAFWAGRRAGLIRRQTNWHSPANAYPGPSISPARSRSAGSSPRLLADRY